MAISKAIFLSLSIGEKFKIGDGLATYHIDKYRSDHGEVITVSHGTQIQGTAYKVTDRYVYLINFLCNRAVRVKFDLGEVKVLA